MSTPYDTWKISEESVWVNSHTRRGNTHLVTDRRVGTCLLNSQFLVSEGKRQEAFEEHQDMCGAPRQLAAVLKLEVADVC